MCNGLYIRLRLELKNIPHPGRDPLKQSINLTEKPKQYRSNPLHTQNWSNQPFSLDIFILDTRRRIEAFCSSVFVFKIERLQTSYNFSSQLYLNCILLSFNKTTQRFELNKVLLLSENFILHLPKVACVTAKTLKSCWHSIILQFLLSGAVIAWAPSPRLVQYEEIECGRVTTTTAKQSSEFHRLRQHVPWHAEKLSFLLKHKKNLWCSQVMFTSAASEDKVTQTSVWT